MAMERMVDAIPLVPVEMLEGTHGRVGPAGTSPVPVPGAAGACEECAGTGVDRVREDGVAERCPICRGSGRRPDPEEQSRHRQRLELWVIALSGVFSVVLAGTLIGAVVDHRSQQDPSSPTSAVSISTTARGMLAQHATKGRTLVEFPPLEEDRIAPVGNDRFQVVTYVDAHDPVLGARLRTHYTLLLRYDRDTNWVLEGLTSTP